MNIKQLLHLAGALLLAGVHGAIAQSTAFTYQGSLTDNGAPANGSFSLRFIFYNAEFGGSQVGPTLTNEPVGGVRFTSGGTTLNQQVAWTPGSASWTFSSDRALKEDIRAIDGEAVLEKLARVPISEWNYKGYSQRHIGPMAQDFHDAFPLNESTTTLNDADLHGVALAAIQGLNRKLEERLKAKEAEVQGLKDRASSLESRLAELEKFVSVLTANSIGNFR